MKKVIFAAFALALSQISYAQVVEVEPIIIEEEELDLSDRNQCVLEMVDFITTLRFLPENEARKILNGQDPVAFTDEVFNILTADLDMFDYCSADVNGKDPKCTKLIKKGIKVFLKYNLNEINSAPACESYTR